MSSESSSVDNSSSESSSDGSNSGSRTRSRSESEQVMTQSPNALGNNMTLERAVEGARSPSHVDAGEETDTGVEIVEEGEEGETTGPVPAAVKGQLDLTPVTYRIGRSRVCEAELDNYAE